MKEVKATFKTTDTGKIPDEWNVVKLGEILEDVLTGATPLRSQKGYWQNGNIPWLTNNEVREGKINYIYNTKEKVTEKALIETNIKLIPANSLILSLTASVGKVAINKIPLTTNQQFNTLILNKRVLPEFLAYYLILSKRQIELLAGITTFKFIGKETIKTLRILLPPLPEQKKIAEILSTVDSAIEKVDEDIEKTQRLKKGLMQELLTKGIGHKEFKNTEMGRIPREWEILNLSEVFRLASGKSRPSEISDIQTEKMLYPIYGGNGILGYTNQSMINKETIVIGRVGEYCGSIHKTTKFSWITDNALYATNVLNHNLNLDFLTYWLTFLNLNKFKKESGQPLMTQTIVYSIKFPLPPLSEQKKIAEILSTVDKRLELLRKKKEKLERVKKGLMNDLLSGKSRVTNLISKEVKR